jgi:hypothetical protein
VDQDILGVAAAPGDYQDFNLENRYINFAVNLGKLGEGKDAFAAHYGTLSLFDATREPTRRSSAPRRRTPRSMR